MYPLLISHNTGAKGYKGVSFQDGERSGVNWGAGRGQKRSKGRDIRKDARAIYKKSDKGS